MGDLQHKLRFDILSVGGFDKLFPERIDSIPSIRDYFDLRDCFDFLISEKNNFFLKTFANY